MRKWPYILVGFALGAVSGAAACYLGLRSHFKALEDELSDKYVKEFNRFQEGLHEAQRAVNEASSKVVDDRPIEERVTHDEAFVRYGSKEAVLASDTVDQRLQEESIYISHGSESSEAEIEVDEEAGTAELYLKPTTAADGWRPPYPIKEEELGPDTSEVMYFCEDDVLLDSDETEMSIMDTVGRQALMLFDTDPDLNVVYARNEKLGLDYVVTRNWGSYTEYMLAGGGEW